MIGDIYKEIHVNTLLNFKDGLCGITWGIEYMIRNGFVEADPDEVLEDLDKRIIEWDVRRITDYSLGTGLQGIACYVISRMENREREHSIINKKYIFDLIEALNRKKEKVEPLLMYTLDKIEARFDPLFGERIDKTIQANREWNPVFRIVDKIRYNAEKVFEASRPLGIDKAGYAGIGLQLMKIHRQ